jgi:hypothetical protein
VTRFLNSQTEHLKISDKSYNWLGNGIYFWLNDPVRAYEWAKEKNKESPAVIGAIIDLGECLDFCERASVKLIQTSYQLLKNEFEEKDIAMPVNKIADGGGFSLARYLDCAVIERLHREMNIKGFSPIDTVKGYFQESSDAYEGAGIKEKSHIQICVRNVNCIKGYFLPR